MKFEKRRPQYEAIQFKGGLESAKEVIEWLFARGIAAAYVPDISTADRQNTHEHIQVRGGLIVHGRGFNVGPSGWIVDDPDSDVFVMSNDNFLAQYEPIPDVSVTNASATFKWACPVDGCQFLAESPGFTYLMEAIGTHNGKGLHG